MWDRFIRACRGEAVDTTPVWFMRQAGRYMAEYRALRAKHTLLEICAEPDLATEVTPAALILESTYSSVPDVGADEYPFMPVRWLARRKIWRPASRRPAAMMVTIAVYPGAGNSPRSRTAR